MLKLCKNCGYKGTYHNTYCVNKTAICFIKCMNCGNRTKDYNAKQLKEAQKEAENAWNNDEVYNTKQRC